MVTLEQLANNLSNAGMTVTIEGDPAKPIEGVNSLEEAGASELSFLANSKYEKKLCDTNAGAVIVRHDTVPPKPLTLIRAEDPYAALMASIVFIHGYRQHPDWGVHASAAIAASAKVGKNARLGPHSTIEDDVTVGDNVVLYPGSYVGRGSRLGDDVILYANVVVYENTILGNRVAIHAGSVIGEDGLGYARVGKEWHKIPHAGHVVIEDDVEIGANCTIDRATLGTTVIGKGSKFSNLIAIGHGTKIGENAMFVAQVGVAGSVTVGKHVQIGGQAGVIGHVTIGDDASVGAKAGVASDVKSDTFVLGQPAIKASEAKRILTITQRLPELKRRVKNLEIEMAELRAAISAEHAAPSD